MQTFCIATFFTPNFQRQLALLFLEISYVWLCGHKQLVFIAIYTNINLSVKENVTSFFDIFFFLDANPAEVLPKNLKHFCTLFQSLKFRTTRPPRSYNFRLIVQCTIYTQILYFSAPKIVVFNQTKKLPAGPLKGNLYSF